MKKTNLITLLFSMALLVGCSQPKPSSDNKKSSSEQGSSASSSDHGSEDYGRDGHLHEWSSAWSYNLTHHWHTCGCTMGEDKNPAACPDIKDKAEHNWDAGEITKQPGVYAEGVKTFTCQDCGATKTERVAGLDGGESQGNFTFNDSDLNTAQEIHTTNQLAYLAFSRPYYTINGSDLNGFSATGASSLQKSSWAPKAVTVSWNYTAPAGKSVSNYTFIYGQTEDLGDGYQITGLSSNSAQFVNPYLGDNYFKVIANLNDGSKEASAVKIFKVTTQAPRNLDVGNMPNVRDMGGRTTYSGAKIKQGLIYRGAGNKFDNSSQVNNECKNVLLNQLKIKTEINVANSTTNNLNFDGVKVENCYMDYGATPYSNLARNAEKIRNVMAILSDRNNYPVFYHCRIGTDRTGITGVMVGGLIGIKFNEIIQDYGFSNFSPIDNQRYPGKTPDNNGDDIKKYIDELLAMPGKNFQQQVYNALLSIGVPAVQLDTIIDIMTDGDVPELGNIANVGVGKYLASDGSKTTSSDFSKPSLSYAISSDKYVSFTSDFTTGDKDIIVYLGCENSNNSTLLASCIKLIIDEEEVEITNTKNLHTAGFGRTQQNQRTGFMINKLAEVYLSEGEHTITIQGVSDTFYIGSIGVFDHVEPQD